MNRRLRNRQARRERKRLAKQYDALQASYQGACQKSEERLVRSLGFDPREKHGYMQMQPTTPRSVWLTLRFFRWAIAHPWLYGLIAMVFAAQFVASIITMPKDSEGKLDLWPVVWFFGMVVFNGMGQIADEARRRAG